MITENSARVFGQLSLFSHLFDEEHRTLPILTEVELHEKATAKTYRSAVRQLLEVDNKRNIVGVSSVGKLIVKIDSRHDLGAISRRIGEAGQTKSKNKRLGMAAIKDIKRYSSVVEEGIAVGDCLKVQLVDYMNNEYNHISQIQLEAFCKRYDLKVEELHYVSNLRLFSIDDISSEALAQITTMDSILSVRKMPTIEFEISPESEQTNIEVMRPRDGVNYPAVGLLDSGVGDIEHLSPWISSEDNIADLLEEDIDRSHGTAVAGVINYGDFLEDRDMTGCGPSKITSCIVNTNPRRTRILEKELVQNIQRAVLAHPEIKI